MNNSGSEIASYTQELSIDNPLAELQASATDYYETDGMGSTTSLTSSSGAIAQSYAFDSFGNTIASTGTLRNLFEYTAREFDAETSLYFYRARYFDPSIGRFLSEDLGEEGSLYDALNLYRYAQNSPTNYADPLGLYTMKPQSPPLPPPSPALDRLLNCIEGRTGLHLIVTSTSEISPPPPKPPTHGPNDPHRRGLAVDIHYPSNPTAVLNAAACCGAKNGLDEKKRHFANTTADNMHLQLVHGPNPKNPGGDLPKNPVCTSCGAQ